ncbi:hypothetical protein AVEN_42569-1 [Araneus ventricosus]|uniref:Uncharacterized protein n=1 Tax=Araneus ventricosus TaxID=182803 RepID=A0A4Y2MLQ6_ARAVE|nr:hypothetical protein AVEN_42569-1 [Araneus ventricosus]
MFSRNYGAEIWRKRITAQVCSHPRFCIMIAKVTTNLDEDSATDWLDSRPNPIHENSCDVRCSPVLMGRKSGEESRLECPPIPRFCIAIASNQLT